MASEVRIRAVERDYPVKRSTSPFDDWGAISEEAQSMTIFRWLIEMQSAGQWQEVGNLSAHAVWYGPTESSKAMNIGISVLEEFRGQGIGSIAQRLLAEELHAQGVVRVEASTDVINIAEQRALKSAGFIYEGTLRKAQGRADGLHDLQVWSHLS
ncbi:MAG: alanine acetyltransferase [Actinomycetota bacterium]|jgi:RimJ/RimL family protein N-acetyltransferase